MYQDSRFSLKVESWKSKGILSNLEDVTQTEFNENDHN